ncbi:GIY-YIG nuclease family protein [Microbacterium sp. W1N]|uniref:GIY-YIG nuclease family protein n=1 Tax=Microbacterium festucae TaxID=2977531 RepID=UPI0021BDF4C5|nr:GIY-YIG nuclease family protein [Microbacterium festucae]MCT9819524.1 GIY-YIG nuclease family protein [Microbacterium festucae]
MDERCRLCGADAVAPASGDDARACAVCGWRVGDVPDPDLPLPVVEVVYYIRWGDRVKIGTSRQPRRRLAVLWHEELLAFERGGRMLERRRHLEFAELRLGGEWFAADPRLLAHIAEVGGGADPWPAYARWFADALRG